MNHSFSRRTAVGMAAAVAAQPARAATPEKIAVIGTGNVGSNLGRRWAALGHAIVYGSRSPDAEKTKSLLAETGPGAKVADPLNAAAQCDMILIAVPSAVAVDVVKSLGKVDGKVIIDATNLLMIKDGKFLEPTDMSCLALQILDAAPNASVIKAFNTTNARVMSDPSITGGPVTIPLAGASRESKARVAALAEALGFETADLGGNDMFRMVEHLGRLYVGFGAQNRPRRLEIHLRAWG